MTDSAAAMPCDLERASERDWRCRRCGRVYRIVGTVASDWQSRTRCGPRDSFFSQSSATSASSAVNSPAAAAAATTELLTLRMAACQQCPELGHTVFADDPGQINRPFCRRDLCDEAGQRRCERRAAGVYSGRIVSARATCERWKKD